MKKILVVLSLYLFIFNASFGQSSLPACEGNDYSFWTRCFGKNVVVSDTYSGEWLDGRRHGQGTNVWANGNYYVGEYKNGLMHGLGTYHHRNKASEWYGRKYVGEWRGDKQNGNGAYFLTDGKKFQSGIYIDNTYQGTEAEYSKRQSDQIRTQKQKEALACLGYKAARFSCASAGNVDQCIAIRMNASTLELFGYQMTCL